jgi:cell division protein FtsB
MNTDTAILLLLADLQRQIEALKAENAALREQIPPPAAPVT